LSTNDFIFLSFFLALYLLEIMLLTRLNFPLPEQLFHIPKIYCLRFGDHTSYTYRYQNPFNCASEFSAAHPWNENHFVKMKR